MLKMGTEEDCGDIVDPDRATVMGSLGVLVEGLVVVDKPGGSGGWCNISLHGTRRQPAAAFSQQRSQRLRSEVEWAGSVGCSRG